MEMNINRISHCVEDFNALEQWAQTGNSSEEIAYAIFCISQNMEEANQIWSNPTPAQNQAVLRIAAELNPNAAFQWGTECYNPVSAENN